MKLPVYGNGIFVEVVAMLTSLLCMISGNALKACLYITEDDRAVWYARQSLCEQKLKNDTPKKSRVSERLKFMIIMYSQLI